MTSPSNQSMSTMSGWWARYGKWLPWMVVGLLLVLRLINLSGPDWFSDDSHYSFRAVAWFDYMEAGNRQSTPVDWFEQAPWWQQLSFHDAPPFVFLVQWLFFGLLGASIFVARLPFVVAGGAALIGLYHLALLLYGRRDVALAVLGALGLMNMHVWISRMGFLEAFVIVFSIWSLVFFLRASQNNRYYLWWGLCMGLGMISKYTYMFMFPVFAGYLLWCRPSAWRNKWLWVGVGIAAVIMAPVVFYNWQLFVHRGHFDAALSSMVGMNPADYSGIYRLPGQDLSPWPLLALWGRWSGIPEIVCGVVGLVAMGWAIYKGERRRGHVLVISALALAVVMVLFAGASDRYLAVVVPFSGIVIGYGAWWLWQWLEGQRRYIGSAVLIICCLWQMTAVVNAQITPFNVDPGSWMKVSGPPWRGYSALESEVGRIVKENNVQVLRFQSQLAQVEKIRASRVSRQKIVTGPATLIVYDSRIDWFAAMWTFRRRILYDNHNIIHLQELAQVSQQNPEIIQAYDQIIFIFGSHGALIDPPTPSDLSSISTALGLPVNGLRLTSHVTNAHGLESFTIYAVQLPQSTPPPLTP